jgi:hypothetical protein
MTPLLRISLFDLYLQVLTGALKFFGNEVYIRLLQIVFVL